ncbi:hypothetical protein [Actomonas aquatica]|uniref:Glycosyltransferase RgtA/B/C/D-like domain-containing protein n=1 Tax=Actomonas aquatica TaxID=2866162 RepID=A0ABZ1C8N5_9BACT|nr:hypothetical protein [Opitutus sp. WL0086]WRQ87740.1 hypothetical protein K1X11_023255 [Opitutus sp. WL0086]
MPPPSRRRLPSATIWLILWLLLGTVHVTQAIWTSGFADLPAGLGDGRFNALILEHGYQSWRGHYDWLSPGQFYPTTHTLGWSDTHLGTQPFYTSARLLGLGPERAMQAWYIVCALLNVLLAVRLLRTLGLDARWAPPIAVGAFAGLNQVWLTGTHPQLLPLFPALWAAGHLVLYLRERAPWRLLAVAGGFAWQFAATPYLAFFAGFVTALALLTARVSGLQLPTASNASLPRPAYFGHLMLAGAGLLAGGVNVWVYSQAVQSGVGRPMHELVDLAPTWASWFSVPPGHWLYSTGWFGGEITNGEHQLLGGLLPWLGALLALAFGLRRNASGPQRLAAVLAATGFVTVLFFVTWPGELSLWLLLGDWIEPLRAFRAAGRISALVHALFFCASGLLLWSWWEKRRRLVPLLLLAALLVETTAVQQPHYSVADAQARRHAIVRAWQQAGDRPVLAWAPGFTNQDMAVQNLDAWAAALSLHRVTLNGYSGGAPATHQFFIWNQYDHAARALLRDQGIDPGTVSIVSTLADPDIAATGYTFYAERPLQRLEAFDLQPVAWDLTVPPERFEFEETVFYQFTPRAEVTFRLPNDVTALRYRTGARIGSWNNGGQSDGYTLRWTIQDAAGNELGGSEEFFNPRDDPSVRGFMDRELPLPSGTNRRLILEAGPGPSGLTNWDWPLIGHLRAVR